MDSEKGFTELIIIKNVYTNASFTLFFYHITNSWHTFFSSSLIITDNYRHTRSVIQFFRIKPSNVQVLEEEDVEFECAVANLQGSVQWSKDGFLLGIYYRLMYTIWIFIDCNLHVNICFCRHHLIDSFSIYRISLTNTWFSSTHNENYSLSRNI